jgi:nitrate reductase gamma subunit
MTVYDIAVWVALILFGIGVVHRVDAWLLRPVGTGDRTAGAGARLGAAARGVASTLFGPRILAVLRTLIVDVLLQWRVLGGGKAPLGWVMHLCIFYGFLLLLVFHALGAYFGGWISDAGYVSTRMPFLALRNAAGLLLAAGLVLAVIRRVAGRRRIHTGAGDVAVLTLLGVLAVSGFVLEAAKITSGRAFSQMVADYAGDASPEDVTALRAYWVSRFGLVWAEPVPSHDAVVLAQGQAVHEASCQLCHDAPSAAFVSYTISGGVAPVAAALDRAGWADWLWYMHVLTACVGLAYVVSSKMFHVVGTPVSLLVAEGSAQPPGAAAAVRQAVELDGCRHGGECHDGCPVLARRLARIGQREPFQPVMAFLTRKNASDLGSRPVSS